MGDDTKPQQGPDLGAWGNLLQKLVTMFGPTDAILIALVIGMFLFFTGIIPNPVLQRVQHVEVTTSRMCAKLTCKPEDDACRDRCWTGHDASH